MSSTSGRPSREKVQEYSARYRAKNAEKTKESTRRWRESNKDAFKAMQNAWREKNKEALAAKAKLKYEANAEKFRAYSKAWRAANKKSAAANCKRLQATAPYRRKAIENAKRWAAANPEKVRVNKRTWERRNPEFCRAKNARRHAAKLNATPAWAEPEIIELIYAEAVHRGLEVDHIVPLQGKTVCGLHVHYNMQLLTKAANASKRNNWSG